MHTIKPQLELKLKQPWVFHFKLCGSWEMMTMNNPHSHLPPWMKQESNQSPLLAGKPQSMKFWTLISSLYSWYDQHWSVFTNRARNESVHCRANWWELLNRLATTQATTPISKPLAKCLPVSSAPATPAGYLGCGGHWQTGRLCAAAHGRWFSWNPQVHSLPWKSKIILLLCSKSKVRVTLKTALANKYVLTCSSEHRVTKPQKSSSGLKFSRKIESKGPTPCVDYYWKQLNVQNGNTGREARRVQQNQS